MAKNCLKSIDEKMSVVIEAVKEIKSPVLSVQAEVMGEKFIDNGDGTILDKETGLMWAKKGSDRELNFKDAEKYCKGFDLAGHKDWRLPTIKELISIIDYERRNPTIDPVFECKSSWYWSGTGYAGDSGGAWYVYFGGGGVGWGSRGYDGYVRPVRQY